MDTPRPRRHVSLKWKAIGLTALLLGSVTVWASVRTYRNELAHFDAQRAAARSRYLTASKGVTALSGANLRHIGGVIASLEGISAALGREDWQSLATIFSTHWPRLQITMGFDSARIYASNGRLVGGWGHSGMPHAASPAPEWLLQLFQEDTPRHGFAALSEGTAFYATVPLVAEGSTRATVVLGGSAADIALSLSLVSGTNVALLARGRTPEPHVLPHAAPWGLRLLAATNPLRTAEVLTALARARPDLEGLQDAARLALGASHYEVWLTSIDSLSQEEPVRLAFVENITAEFTAIRDHAGEVLGQGFLLLVGAEFVLYLILAPPLNRLRHTAAALPLLAEGGLDAVRRHLKSLPSLHSPHLPDEIDLLSDTTLTVATRLDALEDEVRENHDALEQQMAALEAERNFVQGLLDTAQVVVLTQSLGGDVSQLNPFGAQLCGVSYTADHPLHFDRLFRGPDDAPVAQLLAPLRTGTTQRVRHETQVQGHAGSVRHLAWVHSRLRDTNLVLSVGMDISARKKAEATLAWLSDHDALTGLHNRKRFSDELQQALDFAQRFERNGAVVLLDIDRFREINEASGHPMGDMVLDVVARTLQRVVRNVDGLARIGSDEFALLLRETTEAGAREFAKKVVLAVQALEVPLRGQRQRISACCGYVLFPDGHEGQGEVLAAAALALAHAKKLGRGSWAAYTKSMQAQAISHDSVAWRNQLEQGFLHDRFVLHYQPIRDVKRHVTNHFEALVRLEDPNGGLIPPNQFIPVCEKTGLVYPLDCLVIEKVAAQLAAIAEPLPDVRIHANLSARTIEHPQFLDTLRGTLEDYQVDPSRLVLEITETVAIEDFTATRERLQAIRAMGCQLALDDFGVGFASLGYVKELDVDYLKIDGSFIRDLAENAEDQILVRAMADIARGFGKRLVAEYVENDAVLQVLSEYGIELAQGWAIGRPQPAEKVFPVVGDPRQGSRALAVL